MDAGILTTIERWLLQDRKTFSARILSVERNVPIDVAESHMHHFLDTHKGDKAYALYILSGPVAETTPVHDSQASSSSIDIDGASNLGTSYYAVKLADEDSVQLIKESFSSPPSVQLYALAPPLSTKPTSAHRIAATSQLAVVQHELKNTLKYVKTWQEANGGVALGAIRPPSDVETIGPAGAGTKGLVNTASEIKARIAPAAELKPIKVEPQSKAKKAEEKKKPSSRKAVQEEDEEMLDDGPIGYADPVENVAETYLQKGGATSKRADGGDKKSTQDEKRRRQKQELMEMMDEDRDGKADPEVASAKSTSTSMMGGSVEKKSEKANVNDAREASATAPSAVPKEKRRVRKQRKVIRKEVTKNEKGYRITKDVEGYESYSSFESSEDEEATKAKRSARKSQPGNDVKAEKQKGEAEIQVVGTAKDNSDASTPAAKEEKPSAAAPPKKVVSGAGSGQQKLSSFFKKKG